MDDKTNATTATAAGGADEAQAATDTPVAGSAGASELQKQRDEYYDLLLRKTAEFDNYRKRVERDRKEMVEWAAADVLTDPKRRALYDEFGADSLRSGTIRRH